MVSLPINPQFAEEQRVKQESQKNVPQVKAVTQKVDDATLQDTKGTLVGTDPLHQQLKLQQII
jgi:hypothetical protein